MSSLARRSLRATAAAAGIAALGVGLAGTAFAAPALPSAPDLPGLDGVSLPAVPELGGLPGVDGASLPAVPELGAPELPALPALPPNEVVMPGVVNLEIPTISTAGPELPSLDALDAFAVPSVSDLGAPELPGELALPENPVVDGVAAFDAGNTVDSASRAQNSAGDMDAFEAAMLLSDLAQSAITGQPLTEGNEIGN